MPGLQMSPIPGGVGSAAYPSARFIENSALEQMEREQAERQQQAPYIVGLSSYLQRNWEQAKTAKEHIQERLIRNLRQRNGRYSRDVQAEIARIGGSDVFVPLTATKCRAAIATLAPIVMPVNDRAWDLVPTPEPEMPPDVHQALLQQLAMEVQGLPEAVITPDFMAQLEERWAEFDERARQILKEEALEARDAMRQLIDDQLVEGGWEEALDGFLEDLVTFPTAFLCGPIVRRRATYRYDRNAGLVRHYELRLEFERVSPFDIYPSAYSRTLQDGFFFHRDRLQISDLEAMKGVDGYDEQAINQVIETYGRGGLREWLAHDNERATEEGRPHDYLQDSSTIEILKYFGPAHGALLRDWGVPGIQDPNKAYEVQAIKIGQFIVMARLNPHLAGKRPYWCTSYEKVPGSIWGKGIADLVEPAQRMVNASARAMANNLGFASGPQVVLNDVSRLPAGFDWQSLRPWGTWPMEGREPGPGAERPAVEFFQPESNAQELAVIIDFWSRQADEDTGLPPYQYGSAERSKGAGETASGQSMLMQAAAKGPQQVVRNMDRDVTSGVIEHTYQHNLMFSDDETIKGDLKTQARGASGVMARELRQMRLNEVLQTTANPIDLQILGAEGRAKLLRASLKDLMDDPAEDILPADEPLGPIMQPGEEDAQQGDQTSMADLARIEVEQARVEVERERVDAQRAQADADRALKERTEMRKVEEDAEVARMREAVALEKAKAENAKLEIEREKLTMQREQADREERQDVRNNERDQAIQQTREQGDAQVTGLQSQLASMQETMLAAVEKVSAEVGDVSSRLDEKISKDEALRSAVLDQIRQKGGAQAKAVANSVSGKL